MAQTTKSDAASRPYSRMAFQDKIKQKELIEKGCAHLKREIDNNSRPLFKNAEKLREHLCKMYPDFRFQSLTALRHFVKEAGIDDKFYSLTRPISGTRIRTTSKVVASLAMRIEQLEKRVEELESAYLGR